MKPYLQTPHYLYSLYGTDPQAGLSEQQVRENRHRFGENRFPEAVQDSWIILFLRQFKNSLIYILLIAVLILFWVENNKYDAFIILGIVFFNAILGSLQEGKAQSILYQLRQLLRSRCVVIRNGKKQTIQDHEVVVGDILLLQAGQRIPADARVIVSHDLHVDEAMLTGESIAVRKTDETAQQELPITQQTMMVFSGTYILSGAGEALVVATGSSTHLGSIHQVVEETHVEAPLKNEMDRLSWGILIVILGLCIILLIIGLWLGKPYKELLIILTALFICVIPEGLPVVMSLTLASGVFRMSRRNVLVKNMQSVEALGRTNVIVVDKTGTLTRNEMVVLVICVEGKRYEVSGEGYNPQGSLQLQGTKVDVLDDTVQKMAYAFSLLNSAEVISIDGRYEVKGDPTQAALYVVSQKLGVDRKKIEKEYKLLYFMPFDISLKYSAGFYEHEQKGIAFVVGAAEIIMQKDQQKKESTQACFDQILEEGLRTVGAGYAEFDIQQIPVNNVDSKQAYLALLQNVQLLGIAGIQDAIRTEVHEMVKKTRAAGLQVIMATGDHKQTALYVAHKVGIFESGDESLHGNQLAEMTDEELLPRLASITVYYRVLPRHKMRIIELWHKKGVLVAMTGDGINDAPSLVAADIGIGMGLIGTEVAKQASDIILMDDSFSSIIQAIKQGRHIFYALRRVILYFFATNLAEVLLVLLALILQLPLPLTAVQILWLNLITDGFLDVALAMEPEESGLLHKKWLLQKKHLIDIPMILKALYIAVPMALGSLILFAYYLPYGLAYARTITLLTMALFQWFNAWNCRSMTLSIFHLNFFANRWLLGAIALVFSLQLTLVYVPFMQMFFQTVPIQLQQWFIIVIVASSIIVLEEIRKLFVRLQVM